MALLVLGALRFLGRGWCFDDLEECTYVSAETHRRFLLAFIEVGSTSWYGLSALFITSLYFLFSEYIFNFVPRFKTHVVFPTTLLEAEEHTPEFMAAQCRGAIASTDAIHIVCEAGMFSTS